MLACPFEQLRERTIYFGRVFYAGFVRLLPCSDDLVNLRSSVSITVVKVRRRKTDIAFTTASTDLCEDVVAFINGLAFFGFDLVRHSER